MILVLLLSLQKLLLLLGFFGSLEGLLLSLCLQCLIDDHRGVASARQSSMEPCCRVVERRCFLQGALISLAIELADI